MQESENGGITIEGTVGRIIYKNPENGYCVLLLECEESDIVTVGTIPQIGEGEQLEVTGEFVYHDIYGEQFSVKSYSKKIHRTTEDIIKYISEGFLKGVGPVMAEKIVNTFGLDTLEIMKNSPEKLSEIKGISLEKARGYSEILKSKESFQDLFLFLTVYDISPASCIRIHNHFGEESLDTIKDNPYSIFSADLGVKFSQADRIAMDLGFEKLCDLRLTSGIYAVLKNALVKGHTCLFSGKLFELTSRLLSRKIEISEETKSIITGDPQILYIESEDVFAIRTVYYTEKFIAGEIKKRAKFVSTDISTEKTENILKENIKSDYLNPDSEQIHAMAQCVQNPVTIVTGGPGTGKTTLLYFLTKYFLNRNKKIALAAPTGRAAKRMHEITGYEAKTIHRLLEFQYKSQTDDFDFVFLKNKSDPVDADVIFVDEASMIDIFIMKALLEAVKTDAKIILMGDINQLPAVGAGNALMDILKSGIVKTIELKKIYRQETGGLIALNSHYILEGKAPVFKNIRDSECIYINRAGDESKSQAALKLYLEILADEYGFDILRDVQILTPTKKGSCGTASLNSMIQNHLSDKRNTGSGKFNKGDKVIQTRNNYEIEWTMVNNPENRGKAVLNGEIGFVADIHEDKNNITVIFDDEKIVDYSLNEIQDLELAYAITVHKSQGSEYKVTILVLPDAPKILKNKNLFYTAVSRARQKVFVISENTIINDMLRNNDVSKRSTLLFKILGEK